MEAGRAENPDDVVAVDRGGGCAYALLVRCPTCRREVPADVGRCRPFCSDRCKLLDLGKWLDGAFVIPGEAATDDDLAADLADSPAPENPRPRSRR